MVSFGNIFLVKSNGDLRTDLSRYGVTDMGSGLVFCYSLTIALTDYGLSSQSGTSQSNARGGIFDDNWDCKVLLER